jgi:hypothetical protein
MFLINVAEFGSSFVQAHGHLHFTQSYMLNVWRSIVCVMNK